MKAYLISKGLKADFDFGTGWSYLGRAAITDWKSSFAPNKLSAVEKGAYEYARTHHVYGSDLVEHSNRASKDLGYAVDKVGNFVASNVESGTRKVMFLSFVDMLHENGLSVKNGLYEAAHNITDITMNNYSPIERPKVYNSLGPLGDVAVNLQSFKHNELSRVALFARQLKEEKSARPILTELAASVAFAGITGTLGFQAADWLYRQITDALGHPDSLTLQVIKLSENATGGYSLSHGGFSLLGVDMSKRLGIASITGNSAMDIAFPGGSKLVDIGKAGWKAGTTRTEMDAKRFAHEIVPRPAATNMDLEWFSKGGLGHNRNTLEGQVQRNTADTISKRFGFTGIHESVEKDKLYQVEQIKQAYTDKRKNILSKIRDDMYLHDKPSEASVQAYINAQGDVRTLVGDIQKMAKQQKVPAKDLAMLQSAMSSSITNLRHAQRLKEAYGTKQ
jgi:hypothetical protein